ncbi:MAG: hypothetical protein ABR915_04055 [Thermoguttaceae bacterium]
MLGFTHRFIIRLALLKTDTFCVLTLLLFVTIGCTKHQSPEPVASKTPPVVPATHSPVAVSVKSILARPEEYVGKRVKVVGWASWVYQLATEENNKVVFLSDTADEDYVKLRRTAVVVRMKVAFPPSLIYRKQVEIVGVCDMDKLPGELPRDVPHPFIKDAEASRLD